MTFRPLAWLRAHADVVVDPAERLPFAVIRSNINLKRLSLICWLGLANEAVEITVAAAYHTLAYLVQIGVNMLIFGATIVCSRRIRRNANPRLRAVATPVAVTVLLLMWQSSIAVLAASGRLSMTYPLILLVAALIFVWPPRALVAIVAGTLGTFVLVVLTAPVSALEQSVAIRMALLAALVATIAGTLIHSARQHDYRMTLTLHARNEELQRRNEELDEVMAFAAHDLRSPLLGLGNVLAFARPRISADDPLAAQTLDEAARSVAGMLALIGRLLDAHEAEHGQLSLVEDDLRIALTDCAARHRAGAAGLGIALVLDLPERAVIARFDPLALERILDNLVSNAIRFSPPGPVTLACDDADGHPRLVVTDRGGGIAPGDRERLFRKFGRARTAPHGGAAGSGLGLFIASVLSQRIGARLAYRPLDTGSAFEVVWDGRSA